MPNLSCEELVPEAVPLRSCRYCHREFDESYFTMMLASTQGRFDSCRNKLSCNSCRTAMGTGYFREDTRWQLEGRCRSFDHRLFFPKDERAMERRAWDTACAGCPVKTECGDFGTLIEGTGVFGGEHLEMGVERAVFTTREERLDCITQLYAQGIPVNAIAYAVGLGSKESVFRELRKAGIPTRTS